MAEIPRLPPLTHGERPPLEEGCLWLGDLSGFEVGGMVRGEGIWPVLYHRCGWISILGHDEGICGDSSTGYLANLIITALEHIAAEGCRGQRGLGRHG